MAEKIGELSGTLACSFEWKIKNFCSLSVKEGNYYESPPIKSIDETWSLILYPNGYSAELSGWVSLLAKRNIAKDSHQNFRLEISMKVNNRIIASRNMNGELIKNCCGWERFVQRSSLLKIREPEGPFGQSYSVNTSDLTISFKAVWNDLIEDAKSGKLSPIGSFILENPQSSWGIIINNYKEMFLNPSDPDAVVKAKGEEFPIHKCILKARCPELALNFKYDMEENRKNIINIEDFEPDIVRDFLLYIYSGCIENRNSENVFQLYVIADKYGMENLKEECAMFMHNNLNMETVCDILYLANHYGELHLLKHAITFVSENSKEVLESSHWKELETKCWEERNDLTYKCLKNITLENPTRRIGDFN